MTNEAIQKAAADMQTSRRAVEAQLTQARPAYEKITLLAGTFDTFREGESHACPEPLHMLSRRGRHDKRSGGAGSFARRIRRLLSAMATPSATPWTRLPLGVRGGCLLTAHEGPLSVCIVAGGEGRIRTDGTLKTYTGFRVRRIRPLCHLSVACLAWCEGGNSNRLRA
jgi:hypothetical protein